jgi:DNA-binding CsgD family transcriptional regulator
VKWTRPFPNGFFAAAPLKNRIAARPRPKIVRVSDIFSNQRSLTKSDFYRHYLEPQGCRHGVVLIFWKGPRLICGITILRTVVQGNLARAEMRLLRHLYPQFLTALQRLGSLEREHSLRTAFEEFVRRLPLPTILLRWNLKLVYQNQAARDFCALWEKGPERARLTKAHSPIPPEILERCRQLKQKWTRAKRPKAPQTSNKEEHVHHPRVPHLRAVIRLRQLSSAGVAQPHFLIECEDLRQPDAPPGGQPKSRLQYFVPLTCREREVVRLVCNGQSNQEIADEAGLSVPTVKQHVHAIFRKLEVSSRSRLIALMR